MTEKQKNTINEMRAKNALFADVMYSYKDCPEEVFAGTIKLKPYDENDPCDNENDDNVFYYFENIDEMISAMDASNNGFDFTILAIHSFLAAGTPTDSNGFEIKRGDHVFYHDDDEMISLVGVVIGDPYEEEIVLKTIDSEIADEITTKPSRCEIDYDCINVNVTDIEWDTEDGMEDSTEEELGLPKEVNIPFGILVDDYALENFGNQLEVQEAISDYLTDTYQFCVNGYSFEFDHKRPNNASIGITEKKFVKAPVPETTDVQKIDELIENLKRKIFRYVEAHENKVILFDKNNQPYINYFESEIEIQALGIFAGTLCVYFDDDEWENYDLNNPDDVEKILDGEYWMSEPLTKENNECYVQAIYDIAKRLKID